MPESLKKLTFDVEHEFDLTEDQAQRIGLMVADNGLIDYRGDYVDGVTGMVHKLAKIHFTADQSKAVYGSETTIDGVDGIKFENTIHVILEDDEGVRTGMNNARGAIPARWHRGVLFEVDGAVWFCGHDDKPGCDREPEADAPILFQVSKMASERPGAEPFDLSAVHLPSEGEFWISREDEPHVVSIPWCSGYADEPEVGDTYPGRTEIRVAEREELAKMVARVHAIEAAPEPSF